MKKYTKILLPIMILCLIISSFMFTSCGCSPTDSKLFNKASDVYAFTAISSISLMDTNNMLAVGSTPTSDETTLAQKVDEYVNFAQNFIGEKSPISTTVVESDNTDYSNKIIAEVLDLNDTKTTYIFYYNEIVPTQNNREVESDEDFEVNTHIDGIVLVNTNTFTLIGEKEVEEDEIEIELTIKLDNNNKVEVSRELENGECEFEYKLYENGEVVEEFSIEVETEDNETELEIETTYNEKTTKFRFSQETKDGKKELKIEYNDGTNTEKIRVKYLENGNRHCYRYTFENNNQVDIEKD